MLRLTHIFAGTVRRVLVSLILASGISLAQGPFVQQSIFLRVADVNKLDIQGGRLALHVALVANPGEELAAAGDASTRLVWTITGENRKITVAMDHASVHYALRLVVRSVSPGAGFAAPEVSLRGTEPRDLIVRVGRSAGSCTLWFRPSVRLEEGPGAVMHTVTYTVTSG